MASWFDVYATVRHLAVGRRPKAGEVSTVFRHHAPDHKIRSLFTPIPRNRTCTQAGIPNWYCGCSGVWEQWWPLTWRRIESIAQAAIDGVNEFVHDSMRAKRVCPKLTFKAVLSCEGQGEALNRLNKQ